MRAYKKIAALSLLAIISSPAYGDQGAEDDALEEMISGKETQESDEGKLLNEIINNALLQAGVEHPFKFSGQFNFSAIFMNQDVKKDKDDSFVVEEGFISFDCLKKCDGIGYGFETMAKISSGLVKCGGPIFRTACLFLESDKIGMFKIGYTRTMGDVFSVDSCGILTAYNGFESQNLSKFYNESSCATVDIGPQYIDDSRAAKISWKSPTVAGFSCGISFTPDSRDMTMFKTNHMKKDGVDERLIYQRGMGQTYSKNIISCGAAYEIGDPAALNARISVAGWFGKGKSGDDDVKVHNVNAYNVDLKIGYGDFKIAFGYTDNGKSLMTENYATENMDGFVEGNRYVTTDPKVGFRRGADAGKIYSVRAAYSLGKLTVSAGYLKSIAKFSDWEKSKADVISIGTQYNVNKTFSLYLEYDNIATNTCDRARAICEANKKGSSIGKNSANMFILGTKVNI